MALIYSSLPTRAALRAGGSELALLKTVERGLSDAYTLFHSVTLLHRPAAENIVLGFQPDLPDCRPKQTGAAWKLGPA